MKRFLVIGLALLMAMICTWGSAFAQDTKALPAVGDVSHGFTVTEVSRIESLDADMVKLTHDRSGARAIFVLNDDTNRGFSIAFHTEPSDDTGKLHILEHAICAASEKYPGQDVFFDSMSQAYLTGINAWTALSATNYYVTSMDEDQLEVMADFYLDCAFHSALLTEPNYFLREGWRYEMPTLEDEITINGIVYNEMKGTLGDITSAAWYNTARTLFPDTYQSRNSGGIPEVIPELSYDELIDFSKACYTPANSVTMLYGDLDMERFLALLNDDYFGVVDPGVQASISAGQAAFDAPVHEVYQFPAAAESEDTGAVIYYSAVIPENESADYINVPVCDVSSALLSDNSSPLMQALNASGIGSEYGVYCVNQGSQRVINFYAVDADAGRDEEFKQIVLDSLSAMIEDGFNEDMMRSIFASAEISLRLQRNSSNVATNLFENLTWIQEMGNDAPLDDAAWYKRADEICVPGYAEEKMLAWVINNPHAALTTTVPVPGLLEKNEQDLADKLAQLKASMTDEEKQALVEQTAEFNEWVVVQTPEETLEKISAVDHTTVHAETPLTEITTAGENGVTIMSAPTDMDMSMIKVRFNLEHLTDSEIARLKMMSYILDASTYSQTEEEVSIGLSRLVNGLYSSVSAYSLEDGSTQRTYDVVWYAPDESLAESVELVFDMILNTDIAANADLLAQNIDAAMANYRSPETIYQYGIYISTAASSGVSSAFNRIGGMPYLEELSAAKMEYAQQPEAFIDSLIELRQKAFHRSDACVMIVGDEDGVARAAIMDELGELPESCGDTLQRLHRADAQNTAFVGSTQSDYLLRGMILDHPSENVTGDKMVLCAILNGEYILPNLRLQMGAYDGSISLRLNGYWYVMYYRGSAVFDADEVIMAMPEFVENMDMTQEQLDAYKLSCISKLVVSSGELNDAMNQMEDSWSGVPEDSILELVEQIRDVTVEDVKALAPVLRDMLNDSGLMVITTAASLEGHEDQFDAIVQLP